MKQKLIVEATISKCKKLCYSTEENKEINRCNFLFDYNEFDQPACQYNVCGAFNKGIYNYFRCEECLKGVYNETENKS